MKITVCRSCDATTQHPAKGLCHKCYMRLVFNPKHADYRKQYHLEHRDRINAYTKEYMKEYNHKNREKINQTNNERYHNGTSNRTSIYKRGANLYWCYSTGKPVHQVIAEKILNRKLKLGECVHHIDNDSLNNAHNNLIICTRSYHTYLHGQNGNP